MLRRIWTKISAYCYIAIGTFFMALATRFVYEPLAMVTGGFSGIAIVIQNYLNVPISLVTFIMNVPLFIWGHFRLGKQFIAKSLWGMISFSIFLAIVPNWNMVGQDLLLASLVGAAIGGVGLGIVMGQGGSTGGSDLLGSILCQCFSNINLSAMIAIIDGLIVALGMITYGAECGLYAIVAVYITSKVLDRILEGLNFSKVIYVISEKTDEMTEVLLRRVGRGVTRLNGIGGFSKQKKDVLMCVLGKKELGEALQIVKNIDSKAFVLIMDAREVRGEGFYDL